MSLLSAFESNSGKKFHWNAFSKVFFFFVKEMHLWIKSFTIVWKTRLDNFARFLKFVTSFWTIFTLTQFINSAKHECPQALKIYLKILLISNTIFLMSFNKYQQKTPLKKLFTKDPSPHLDTTLFVSTKTSLTRIISIKSFSRVQL